MNTAHRLADGFRSVIGYWTPTPTVSQFIEKGTLTPQEFVDGGDQLTFKFPTWKWQPAEGRRQVSWLPANKQYLATYGVPCHSRVRDLDRVLAKSSLVSSEVDEKTPSPWFMPFCDDPGDPVMTSAVTYGQESTCSPSPGVVCFSDIDDILDADDDAVSITRPTHILTPDAGDSSADVLVLGGGSGTLPLVAEAISSTQTRSYDLSVTYDKYYQCPRLWLKGYDKQGLPLDSSQIFEDMLTEYISKTVTIDPHPCTGELTVSIHPCRHAAMMKKVVDGWLSNGVTPRHDLALIVLLKFISSVIPTIQYDTTLDVDGFSMSIPSRSLPSFCGQPNGTITTASEISLSSSSTAVVSSAPVDDQKDGATYRS